MLALCSGSAHAETRIDLAPIPDVSVLEQIYLLDRYRDREQGDWCDTGRTGKRGSVTLGLGEDVAGAVSAAGGVGMRDALQLGFSTELVGERDRFTRGRHRALAAIAGGEDDDFGFKLAVTGALDHGLAPGLAPIAHGGGRRVIASGHATGLVQLGKEKNDFVWVAALDAELGASYFEDATIERSERRSGGLALGRAPIDGELPRGRIDVIRGRVEHVAITRPIAAAAAPAMADGVRIVELGLGPKELTFHIDREMLTVLDVDFGWSWLEAGAVRDDMFRMRLASSIGWIGRTERQKIGVAIAREPTHSADGQRIVSEWRTALATSAERKRFVIDAAGGISWGSVKAGGPPATTLMRYGGQLDAFAKVGHGLEIGGYAATWFEPAGAGDAWIAPRRWTTESGLALRLRRP